MRCKDSAARVGWRRPTDRVRLLRRIGTSAPPLHLRAHSAGSCPARTASTTGRIGSLPPADAARAGRTGTAPTTSRAGMPPQAGVGRVMFGSGSGVGLAGRRWVRAGATGWLVTGGRWWMGEVRPRRPRDRGDSWDLRGWGGWVDARRLRSVSLSCRPRLRSGLRRRALPRRPSTWSVTVEPVDSGSRDHPTDPGDRSRAWRLLPLRVLPRQIPPGRWGAGGQGCAAGRAFSCVSGVFGLVSGRPRWGGRRGRCRW